MNIIENDKFYIIWGSLNRPILWGKKDIFKMTFMSEARNGIWLYDNERENTAEKNDFMTISNYLSTVLINLLHTHTHSLWWLNCFKE